MTRAVVCVALVLVGSQANFAPAADSPLLTRKSALSALQEQRDPYRDLGEIVPVAERVACWTANCHDAFLFLSVVSDVDAELAACTATAQPLEVQYRGMQLLAMRGSTKGLRLAAEWMRSESRSQRFAAWNAVNACPNSDVVWNVLSPELVLALYRAEQDSMVKFKIIEVFGRHKARFAVDTLCRSLAFPLIGKSDDFIVRALGEIGDPRAVEVLTRAPRISEEIVTALGKIGDAKGANCVIEHLSVPSAPLALARIGGAKALPALKRNLDQVAWREEISNERNLAAEQGARDHRVEVGMAISLLEGADAQVALLAVAESGQYSAAIRSLALEELQRRGVSRVRSRFLTLYRSEIAASEQTSAKGQCVPPSEVLSRCISIAADDAEDETTEALIEHLRQLSKASAWLQTDQTQTRAAAFSYAMHRGVTSMVIHALHNRIGNEVFALRARLADQLSAEEGADASD